MSLDGLKLCTKYAYPPNSLSLCGPEKQEDLSWYLKIGKVDSGTKEILTQFSTLYPYLRLIAQENKISDPFDPQVIEAYWLGNNLLHDIPIRQFATHLRETIGLEKKVRRSDLELILRKIPFGALPYHAFHVLNVYVRTGHLDIPYTLETMNACIINWGKVVEIHKNDIVIKTQKLLKKKSVLTFQNGIHRTIHMHVPILLHVGDTVSYHWGMMCERLTQTKLLNLIFYTNLSLRLANMDAHLTPVCSS